MADDIIAAVMCAVILAAAAWAVCPRKPRPRAVPDNGIEALADATREPRPRTHPELCPADKYYAANLRTWLTTHPETRVIAANGRSLADYLRQAVPDAGDLDLARVTRAMLRATPQYRALDDPYVMFCDSLAAAWLDLTALERSTTP